MKQETNLEKSNIRFVCLNEAICPIIPQRLADQKAKMIKYIDERIKYCTHSANEFKVCKDDIAMNQMYARVNELKGLLKKFEELI